MHLDGDMQHVYCYIHAGVNLATKFDKIFKNHGSSSSKLRANVEGEAEEDNDVEPELAPEEYEMEALLDPRLLYPCSPRPSPNPNPNWRL